MLKVFLRSVFKINFYLILLNRMKVTKRAKINKKTVMKVCAVPMQYRVVGV